MITADDFVRANHPWIKVRYTGTCNSLVGQTAMAVQSKGSPHILKVQFDNMELEHDGEQMGYNWHLFAASMFESDEDPLPG